MRTPAIYKTNTTTNHVQQDEVQTILARCFKRKSSDMDLSQPQSKSDKKTLNDKIFCDQTQLIQSNSHLNRHQQQQQPQQQSVTHHNQHNHHHHPHHHHQTIYTTADNLKLTNNNSVYTTENSSYEFVNVICDTTTTTNSLPNISGQHFQLNTLNGEWNNTEILDLNHNDHENIDNRSDESVDNNKISQSEDLEDKNLSWLFNFKLDELPHLSPDMKNRNTNNKTTNHNNKQLTEKETFLNIEVGENVTVENSYVQVPKKPPFTYTELIEYALEDRGELTVSGIYQWISDRFSFYKSNDDRWKNSVRHNLSINPHFRKGNKAPQGAGHLWTISSRDSDTNMLAWEHKKQRLELFLKMEAANTNSNKTHENETPQNIQPYDETAAATASIAFINDENKSPDSQSHIESLQEDYTYHHHTDYSMETSNNDELRRSADEILNGVRRNVEVQVLNPPTYNNFHAFALLESGDYLNPVSKDVIAQECGLRSTERSNEIGNDFYVTEIDPIELGINMSTNGDDEVLFGDDFNLTYLGISNNSNIMT